MTVEPFTLLAPILSPESATSASWIPHGALSVDGSGRILYCGDHGAIPETLAGLPTRILDGVLVPGFVDCHTHLPQYDCRGKFGVTLMEWLDHFIYPEEARFADERVARDVARRFFRGLLEAGTTTAAVYSSVHTRATWVAFEEAERARLRVILGKVLMDRDAPDALCEPVATAVRETRALIEAWHHKTPRLLYAVTPRFAPTCSPALLRAAAEIADEMSVYVQTHLNESPAEIALVSSLFPSASSYTRVYDEAGLLGPRTILAHNIHPDDSELDLCEERNAAVAHCPDSNLFLGSGRFPLERYDGRSIRIGLGSDVGAGTSLSMPVVMRSMAWVQGRSLHPFALLYHATLGGARALSLDDETGTLRAGLSADMVEIRIDEHFAKGRHLTDLRAIEAASAVVYRSETHDVRRVWMGGELLYDRDGRGSLIPE